MDITNKTKKPLMVPLPGAKKLFLQPGKTGQVTPKALEFAPLVKLIEEGAVTTSEIGSGSQSRGASSSNPIAGVSGHKGTGAMRQSGDR